MSDMKYKTPLVDRLTGYPITRALCEEAADEIKRLQKIERLYCPPNAGTRPDYPADGFINDYD